MNQPVFFRIAHARTSSRIPSRIQAPYTVYIVNGQVATWKVHKLTCTRKVRGRVM